jgi:hypothetical protein
MIVRTFVGTNIMERATAIPAQWWQIGRHQAGGHCYGIGGVPRGGGQHCGRGRQPRGSPVAACKEPPRGSWLPPPWKLPWCPLVASWRLPWSYLAATNEDIGGCQLLGGYQAGSSEGGGCPSLACLAPLSLLTTSLSFLSPRLCFVAAAWPAPPHQPSWYLPPAWPAPPHQPPWYLPAVLTSQSTQLPLGLHIRNAIPSDVILAPLVPTVPLVPTRCVHFPAHSATAWSTH